MIDPHRHSLATMLESAGIVPLLVTGDGELAS